MKIAHFSDSQPGRVDGVSTSATLAVDLLRQAGHEVRYLHPGPVRTVPVPFRQLRLAAPWLRLDPGDVDVVHAHTTGPIGMAGFRFARERGVPLVVTWHTDLVAYADHFFEVPIGAAYCASRLGLGWSAREAWELTERHGRRRERLLALGRGMMRYATLVLAPSEKTAAALTEFGALPPVRVLPTPVVLPAAPGAATGAATGDATGAAAGAAARASAGDAAGVATGAAARASAGDGLARTGPVVLSVGRVTGEKNPELLIRAFDLVRRAIPAARLVVVGVRQGARPVRALIAELGLTGAVTLLPPGPRARVIDHYRAADVLAFAATTDTQSLVMAEAEACGLPVVLADAALAASAPHRLSSEPSPAGFGAALIRMLTDEALRDRSRRAGLAAAAAYSPEEFLRRLVDAYELGAARVSR